MTDPFLLVWRENSTNLCYFPCMLFVILVADMLVRPYLPCSSQYMLYSVCTTDSKSESSKIRLPQLGLCNKNLYFTEFIFIYHAFLYTAQTWESRQVEVGIKAFFIVNFMLYWHLVAKCRWTKSTKNTSWPTVTRNWLLEVVTLIVFAFMWLEFFSVRCVWIWFKLTEATLGWVFVKGFYQEGRASKMYTSVLCCFHTKYNSSILLDCHEKCAWRFSSLNTVASQRNSVIPICRESKHLTAVD